MGTLHPTEPTQAASGLLAVTGALAAVAAATLVLASFSGPDVFAATIVGGAAAVAVAGAVAGWTGRAALLWVAALALAAGSVLGALTVGALFAPAAVCLLGAALLSGWMGPSTERATPVTPRQVAVGSLVGMAGVTVGAWVVRVAAFDHELFGSCAVETAACAVATTNWVAVAATVTGLLVVGLGGRSLLRAAAGAWRLVRGPTVA